MKNINKLVFFEILTVGRGFTLGLRKLLYLKVFSVVK
jgi:hypothetical protein